MIGMETDKIKFGNDLFPICKELDYVDGRLIYDKLTLRQRLQLYLFGRIKLPQAKWRDGVDIFFVARGASLALSYPQGFEGELEVDWDD